MGTIKPEINYWYEFGSVLKERFFKPFKHPTFVMYFLGIIVILGGFGIAEPMMNCWIFGKLPTADCRAAIKGEHCASKPGQVCEQRRTPPALRALRRLERSESRREARRAGAIHSVNRWVYGILPLMKNIIDSFPTVSAHP